MDSKAEETRTAAAEKLILHYLNNYLFDHGVISQRDRDRMAVEIVQRRPLAKKQEAEK